MKVLAQFLYQFVSRCMQTKNGCFSEIRKEKQHFEESKIELESLFEETAKKRQEVIKRENAVSTREDELRKVEAEVQNIMKQKKKFVDEKQNLDQARKKYLILCTKSVYFWVF